MKYTKILHGGAAIAGVLGVLSLISAWIAEIGGTFLGLSQAHLYNDAMSLLLVSIAFGIGTLIHIHLEKK